MIILILRAVSGDIESFVLTLCLNECSNYAYNTIFIQLFIQQHQSIMKRMYYRRAVGLSNGALIHLKFDKLHYLSGYRGCRDVEISEGRFSIKLLL
ncbi:hypothetical protein EA58_14445 [Photobacterium galatheae]|uniref:Uncharacterized protein n=1 Tax=Photobacterium galatheae TaxID=1654360 RepID=A0A066RP93_9GAMM|nr:hypothetical protein EA58_14445 [Photobacterium galatheae]